MDQIGEIDWASWVERRVVPVEPCMVVALARATVGVADNIVVAEWVDLGPDCIAVGVVAAVETPDGASQLRKDYQVAADTAAFACFAVVA